QPSMLGWPGWRMRHPAGPLMSGPDPTFKTLLCEGDVLVAGDDVRHVHKPLHTRSNAFEIRAQLEEERRRDLVQSVRQFSIDLVALGLIVLRLALFDELVRLLILDLASGVVRALAVPQRAEILSRIGSVAEPAGAPQVVDPITFIEAICMR